MAVWCPSICVVGAMGVYLFRTSAFGDIGIYSKRMSEMWGNMLHGDIIASVFEGPED